MANTESPVERPVERQVKDIQNLYRERSGRNYHGAEFIFRIHPIQSIYTLNLSAQYRSSCKASKFKWIFRIKFGLVLPQNTFKCVIFMKLIECQRSPLRVTVGLAFVSPVGIPDPPSPIPEFEAEIGQNIFKVIDEVADHSIIEIHHVLNEPLSVHVQFLFKDCHENEREPEVLPNSHEACAISAKSKF